MPRSSAVRGVSDELRFWRFGSTVQELAWIFPLLALLSWAFAIGIAADRRRTVEGIGLATAGGGLLVLVGLRVGGALVVGAIDDSTTRDAGRAVWDTYTEGLRTLGWFGIGIGLLVTAAALAARPEPSRLDPAHLRARIGGVLRANPSNRWGWGARILLAGGLGIFMIASPLRFAELALVRPRRRVGVLRARRRLRAARPARRGRGAARCTADAPSSSRWCSGSHSPSARPSC